MALFLIKTQADMNNPVIKLLQVEDPHPLNIFGIFVGTNGFRYLKRFKAETYESQLRESAGDFISKKLSVNKNSNLVLSERIIHWALMQVGSCGMLTSVTYLYNEILTERQDMFKDKIKFIMEDLESMRKTDENYVIKFNWFCWKVRCKRIIKELKKDEELRLLRTTKFSL